jgi:small conductance mechanosensitive channel
MQDAIAMIIASIPTVLLVVGIVLATVVLARRVRTMVHAGVMRMGMPGEIAMVAASSSNAVVLVLGIAIALAQAGWVTAASSFVAGLGITGIIVGFALQDTIKNYAAGVMILYHRPYHVGDDVQFGSIRGLVTALRLHMTILRREDGIIVEIPSSVITNGPIINYTRAGLRRITIRITLERNIDIETVVRDLTDVLRQTPHVANEPIPTVSVIGMEGEQIVFEVGGWASAGDDASGATRTHMMAAIDRFLVANQPTKRNKSSLKISG